MTEKRGLKQGDLVLVTDTTLPRCQWSVGRVLASPSGNQRSIEIKTMSGTIARPFSKVCLLETDLEPQPEVVADHGTKAGVAPAVEE